MNITKDNEGLFHIVLSEEEMRNLDTLVYMGYSNSNLGKEFQEIHTEIEMSYDTLKDVK